MQLFYNASLSEETKEIVFSREESRHIIKVLRKKEHDTLHITNGKGFLFKASIQIASDKKCLAKIIASESKPKYWDYYLHVAIAPTKNMDRFEWFLEKATEIGIDEITPIVCNNSERKIIKKERLDKIIQAAMKQSLKFNLPILNDIVSFSDFMNKPFKDSIFIAHCKDSEKINFKNINPVNKNITLLIGPEGDFSEQEIKEAYSKQIRAISLGKSRLRTETAGVVAVQNISFLFHK